MGVPYTYLKIRLTVAKCMHISGIVQKLANIIDSEGDVWSSEGMILNNSYNAGIVKRINKGKPSTLER